MEKMEDMHCSSQKVCKLVSELEKNAGLIKKKRRDLGKPSLIYVVKSSTVCSQNDPESQFWKSENHNPIISRKGGWQKKTPGR